MMFQSQAYSVRSLGLFIDEKPSWQTSIEKLCKKICYYAQNNAGFTCQSLPAAKKISPRPAKKNAGNQTDSMETQSINVLYNNFFTSQELQNN